ncbi:acyltransferase domain-containing protein, partial [Streptosporangium lutulentum]
MNRETTPADAEHPTTVLLPLSGTDSRAVAELAERYERALADDGVRLADLAYTAGALSPHTAPHDGPRAAGVVATTGEARQWLADVSRQPPAAGLAPVDAGRLVLVFSGQGNQWLGMGRGLAAEPVAGRVLAECDEILTRLAGWSLTAELAATEETSRLEDPAVLQPVLVALQTAVVRQLESWGVVADACIGHSLGEISAAVACGALTLEDALYLAVVRGDLMREIVGSGRTALLGVSAEEAATRIARHGGDAEIAAWNAPRSTLIAGAAATVGRVVDELAVEEVFARMLPGSVAFHSRYVAPVHDKITELAGGIVARDAGTTMVSTVTGGVVPGSGLDSRYWGGNLREPVRFLQGVRFLADQGHRVFVEIGAHPTLSPSIIESLAGTEALVVPTLRRGVPERDALLTTAARLYEAGAALDFSALSPPDRRAVRLRPAPARRDTGPAVTVSPREAFGDLPGGLSLWRGTVTRTPAHGRFHLYGEPLASFALIAGTALAACPAGPYELDVRLAG